MNIEHVAFNVRDPEALEAWLVKHLGLRTVLAGTQPQHGRFLADEAGHGIVEIYHNVAVPTVEDAPPDPSSLHLAFSVSDVDAERKRLIAAGGKPVGEPAENAAGDRFAIVRAPGGLPIQLVRRVKPLLPPAPEEGKP